MSQECICFVLAILALRGVDGQFVVTIVSSPAGTPVSGYTNTFDYPILSSVTLTCDVTSNDASSFYVSYYQWNTAGCYTHPNFNSGNPRCFPHGHTGQTVTGTYLNAEDAGTITCTVTISGSYYTSESITLRISGIALLSGSHVTSGYALTDYSCFYASDSYYYYSTQIARCMTGLGPSDTNDNSALGGLYFNGSRIPNGNCYSAVVLPKAEYLYNYVGAINIYQCGYFSIAAEGVYTCIMMNSSMMNESVRFGVYFTYRTAPVIDTPSSSTVTVAIGSSLTLSCTSRGSPPDTFTWRKDNDPTVLQSTSITSVDHTSTNAVFHANYSIDNVTTSDSGTYTCTVANPIGNDNTTITVAVSVPTPTVIVTAPHIQTVGQSLTLQCEVTTVRGVTSRVDIVWSSDGTVLRRMNGVPSTTMDNSLVFRDSYTISPLSTTDEKRVYKCEVVINASPPIRDDDNIVLDVTVPTPTVIISPSGSIQGAMVSSPQVINCTVSTVNGVDLNSLIISWNGPAEDPVTTDCRVAIKLLNSISNTYISSLQFDYLMEGDEGMYTCNVMILEASRSDSVELSLNSVCICPDVTSSIQTPNVPLSTKSTRTSSIRTPNVPLSTKSANTNSKVSCDDDNKKTIIGLMVVVAVLTVGLIVVTVIIFLMRRKFKQLELQYMVSHVHRRIDSSTEPMNVNAIKFCKKTGVVYQSVDNDETQVAKPSDNTAANNIATSNVQENPAPEMNETKTIT